MARISQFHPDSRNLWLLLRPILKESSCGGTHSPGDRLACYVTFQRGTALTNVYLDFNLLTPVPKDQQGLCNGFVLPASMRIDAQTYKVTGTLPACISGSYFISDMTVFDADRHSYLYKSPFGRNRSTVVDLSNSHQKLFPDLKRLGP